MKRPDYHLPRPSATHPGNGTLHQFARSLATKAVLHEDDRVSLVNRLHDARRDPYGRPAYGDLADAMGLQLQDAHLTHDMDQAWFPRTKSPSDFVNARRLSAVTHIASIFRDVREGLKGLENDAEIGRIIDEHLEMARNEKSVLKERIRPALPAPPPSVGACSRDEAVATIVSDIILENADRRGWSRHRPQRIEHSQGVASSSSRTEGRTQPEELERE
ncbi:hypothetical protein [Stenotrophomonas maltophilia]|uniref:hypothetical protein n=1 Tax=Stenotrophomonas maltophilia TaxID=40324 RepID=UPI003D7CF7D9